MKAGLQARLDALYKGILALRKEGLAVDAIAPAGAIYLTARFALSGKRTSSGETLHSNDNIRKYLLREAGLAIVPFQAFGMKDESGWFRLSVGAVSTEEISGMLPRLKQTLGMLT